MKYLEIARSVFDIEVQGLKEVKDLLPNNFDEIVDLIVKSNGRVMITGMGKSGLVGKKISATLASTGTRSYFMHPGEAYHGDLGMIHGEDVIIAISHSGETEEVVKLLPFFQENGNKVIALTGKGDSTLCKHSDYLLSIAISKEACPLELAPTTSTTATMAVGDALAVALMKARNFQAENFARFHPGGSLGRKLLTKVSDVMKTDNLPILGENMPFDEIITVLSKGRMGLGVILQSEKARAVITDGDIRRLLKEKKENALKMQAKDFMTRPPITISGSEKIVTAERMMQDKKVTALLVEDHGKFQGILHRYDI